MGIDDDRLLAAARHGDERAFSALVRNHQPGLATYCRLMLGCPERGDAAMREALLRAWCEMGRFDERVSARIWLYRLATGVCLERGELTD